VNQERDDSSDVAQNGAPSPEAQRLRVLEDRLLEAKGRLAAATAQNEKLSYTLRESREHIAALRDEVDKLTRPPSPYGVVASRNDDGTLDIHSMGRKMRVEVDPTLEMDDIEPGDEVYLNDSSAVIGHRRSDPVGEVATLQHLLEDGVRVVVTGRGDEERVCELAGSLRERGSVSAIEFGSIPGRRSSLKCFLAPRLTNFCWRRFPTSATTTSADSARRSKRSLMRSNFRSFTKNSSPSTASQRPRASCCTALLAAARPSLRRQLRTAWRARSPPR